MSICSQHLHTVLEHCHEHRTTVNASKFVFACRTVQFSACALTPDWLVAEKCKAKAIHDFPSPVWEITPQALHQPLTSYTPFSDPKTPLCEPKTTKLHSSVCNRPCCYRRCTCVGTDKVCMCLPSLPHFTLVTDH